MKPFFTTEMLVELNLKEVANLRIAVGHMMDMYSEQDNKGNYIFEKEYMTWKNLYMDLTKILEILPF